MRRTIELLLALLAAAPSAALAAAVPQRDRAAPRSAAGRDEPAHRHTWVQATRKEWVPPEKQRVQVGTDAAGNPIWEWRIVKPGYWRVVTYSRCACGATRG